MTTDAQGNELCKLFVGGLHQTTNNDSLREYFSKFGDVEEATVMIDHSTGRSRGFGYVRFSKDESVEGVLKVKRHVLNGREVDSKRCNVNMKGKNRRSLKIFVGGIAPDVYEEQVKLAFEKYGKVTDVNLMTDQTKQRHRGFAFVSFESEDVVKALIQMHHINIVGRQVEIKPMEPPNSQRQNTFQNFVHYPGQATFYPNFNTNVGHTSYAPPHFFGNTGHAPSPSRHFGNNPDMNNHIGRNSYYDYSSNGANHMVMPASHYTSIEQHTLNQAPNNPTEYGHLETGTYDMTFGNHGSANNHLSGANMWPNSGIQSNWSPSMNWQNAPNYASQQWSELINGTASLLISSQQNATDHVSASSGSVGWQFNKYPGAAVCGGTTGDDSGIVSVPLTHFGSHQQHMNFSSGELDTWRDINDPVVNGTPVSKSSPLQTGMTWPAESPSSLLCLNGEGKGCSNDNTHGLNTTVGHCGSPVVASHEHVNALSLLSSTQLANNCPNPNTNAINSTKIKDNNCIGVAMFGSTNPQLVQRSINLPMQLTYNGNSFNNLDAGGLHSSNTIAYQGLCGSSIAPTQPPNR